MLRRTFRDAAWCRLFILTICLFGWPAALPATTEAAFARFEQLTIEDGLRQNTVGSLLQDSQGFIWIGTEAGLHRYDGHEFRLFHHQPDDRASLADNFAITLAEDPEGFIWVGTMSGGIHRLDPRRGRIERVPTRGAEADRHGLIWGIHVGPEGDVWAVTHDGVLLKKAEEDSFRVLESAESEGEVPVATPPYVAITEDDQGDIVLGTTHGLARLDDEQKIVAWRERQDGTALPADGFVSELFRDKQDRLWVGGAEGIYYLPPEGGIVRFEDDHPLTVATTQAAVWDIRQDGDGQLWLATYGGGLIRYHPETDEFRHFEPDPALPRSLAENNLMSLLVDRSGLIWVGTESSGLQRLNPQALSFGHFGHHPLDEASLPHPVVWAIESHDDGRLWVGTQAGLARLDWPGSEGLQTASRLQAEKEGSEPHISSLHDNGRDRLWIASMEGLWWKDISGESDDSYHRIPLFTRLEEDSPEYWYPIFSVSGDGSGVIYLTLGDSVVAGRPSDDADNDEGMHWQRILEGDRTGLGELHGLWVGRDDHLWIAGTRGVARYDLAEDQVELRIGAEEWQGEGQLLPLRHGGVSGIAEESEEVVWLATQSGLYRVDTVRNDIRHLDASKGLPADTVYGVTLDTRGRVWASTSLGLTVLDPDSGDMQSFDVRDGLQSNEFNAGAVKKLADGRLAFGGLNGINLFDPERLEMRSPPPAVTITAVTIGGRKYNDFEFPDKDEGLTVPYDQRFVEIRYAALDFRNLAKNRFQYRLEGFDDNWRDAGRINRAMFTNLPPGDYRFRVRAANSLGIWNEEGAVLPIRIETPPWLHPLAFIAYLFLVMALLYLGFRLYERRQQRESLIQQERERRVLAEKLHKVSTRLASSLDSKLVLDRLADILGDLLDADAVALFLAEDGQLQCRGSRGDAGARRSVERVMALLPDAVERTRSTGVVQLLEHGELLILSHPNAKQASGALVPLMISEEDFGLLVLTRTGEAFSQLERDLLSSVGTQAMMALQKARLFAQVEELATTDGLTGLLNRRHFETCAMDELARSRRYGHEATLILLDIDHFKRINDRFGHELGDNCLRQFSSLLVETMRQSDLVGRFGGEEFIALLPETGLDRGLEVAERVRAAVEELFLLPHINAGDLTISIGVTLVTADDGLDDIVRRADAALYQAKRSGRNRVIVDNSPNPDES